MRLVPWWGVVTAAAAPVLLAVGWIVAASLQPRPFNPVAQSVSTLAARGATDRWVMSLAFLLTACCYVAVGVALRPAGTAGRAILISAGIAGLFVVLSPQAANGGFSLAHAFWSAMGFALLAAWPIAATRRGDSAPWALRLPIAVGAVALFCCLLAWFVAELLAGGQQIGLAERVAGEAQALWPVTVAVSCYLAERQALRGLRVDGDAQPFRLARRSR